MTLRFGTDGVRGVANAELTPELVLALGRAAARVLDAARVGRVVTGRDTRRSGPLLESALAAGFAAEGIDVDLLGVVPTPTVAWVAATDGLPGAVISASHNPFADNGVKLFGAGGAKLSDSDEERLEAELDRILKGEEPEAPVPTGAKVGQIRPAEGLVSRWGDALLGSLDGRRLDGLQVVIDCANGAASRHAASLLTRLGADVEVIHDQPDGRNINDGCGSTHPDDLRAAVVAAGADAGLAFDGDADRVLAVDDTGTLLDGDQMIAMLAIDRHERGALADDTVVVTVYSNIGLRLAMAERGIGVVETQVGDRYVLEALERGGWPLGGEQSGHIIFRDLATTGDGILTGIQLLDLLVRSGRPLSELAATTMTRYPQVLRNVRIAGRAGAVVSAISEEVDRVERELGERGRVLVRASGTEPVVRVMVEAETSASAEAAVDELVAAVEAAASRSGTTAP
ncbi:phosphoglucosamine mutase [Actinomarinicola tropica]|uniref:Phosphoglucosamine mutase n=1 Tax=Actinomarinicola tropica TaxID=2789776 RepID=A0A5Q2RL34_9ACTN|nr:phosphoglucosamine mutase [Actinomarinicola tropica]QGG93895.1 phosphoglucosamine mutase [Actinomarinicola tropica]